MLILYKMLNQNEIKFYKNILFNFLLVLSKNLELNSKICNKNKNICMYIYNFNRFVEKNNIKRSIQKPNKQKYAIKYLSIICATCFLFV